MKELSIQEVLNSDSKNNELFENCWILRAEERVEKHNDLYKQYIIRKRVVKKGVNHPTKIYPKSIWFKYV